MFGLTHFPEQHTNSSSVQPCADAVMVHALGCSQIPVQMSLNDVTVRMRIKRSALKALVGENIPWQLRYTGSISVYQGSDGVYEISTVILRLVEGPLPWKRHSSSRFGNNKMEVKSLG